jgi:TP901 family phage tail tape measure protein
MGLLGSLGQVAYDIIANDKTGEGSKSSEKNLIAVGAAMTGVGVAAIAMTSDVKRSFLSFEESTTAIKALGVLSEEEFNRAKQAALDMSKQFPVSATEVTGAMYNMISVGYDFDTMMKVLPEAIQLSVGGNMDLAEAVDTVINVFGAYGEGVYSAADVTNILAKAVGVGKWELGDFTDEIMKNVGSASTLGIEFDELAAANVLLQNSFTSSEVAGTSLNTMLTRLVDPAVIKKLEDMGVHVKDNEGNFVGLKSVLDQLDVALQGTGGNVEKMSILQEIFGTYGVKAAMALLEEKDSLGELTGEMNDAEFKTQSFNTVLESTSSQLEIATNKTEAAKIAFGEAMAPAMMLTADATGLVADVLSALPDPLQSVAGLAIYAAQGFAVLGPALMGLAALKSLGIGASIAGIGTSLASAAGSIGVFLVAAAPLLAILAGLALGLAAVYVMNELGVFDWIYNAGYEFGGFVMGAGADFREWLDGVPGWCEEASSGAVNWFTGLPDAIGGAVASIPETVGGAFSGLVDIVGNVLGGIPGALVGSFSIIAEAFMALGGRVQEAFSNLFTGISEFIVGLAQGFISAGYNIIMYIVQGMQSAAGAVAGAIGDIFGLIGQFIPHSPAETGPLSQLPNFGAYFVDPLLATVPAVEAASVQVAEAVVMPAAQPASMSGGTNIGSQDNSSTIDIGSINASSDYPIDKIMADIAAMQAQRRTQRGYTT